jgi:hypothetical protein
VERDPLAIGVAIMTVHAGRLAREAEPQTPAPVEPVLRALDDDLHAPAAASPPSRAHPGGDAHDGRLILDLIGRDASPEDVGELIVALGLLGAILAEQTAEATGRPTTEVLHDLALRFAA